MFRSSFVSAPCGSSETVFHAEEPDFQGCLQVLAQPEPGKASGLRLTRGPVSRRPRTGGFSMVTLSLASPVTVGDPIPRHPTAHRGLAIPLLVLAATFLLGYVAAVQSAFAF